ncbi:MAG: S8 family serine peptidase [Deltaproteobacteria bacterium]|nr:S8 family serine peptidase [Deltaproteobacteria bacterium]MBW2137711.1 S8 family serine peptidase [Deltaproteobacteria bacterium]
MSSLREAGFSLAFLLLIVASPIVLAETAPLAGDARIEIKNGLVSLDVREAELPALLTEIARKAHVEITIDRGVEGTVTVKFERKPLEEAIKKLCESTALVFEYDPHKNAYRIIRAGAFPQMKGAMEDPAQSRALDGGPGRESGRIANGQEKLTANNAEEIYDRKGRLLYKPGELLVRFKEEVPREQIAGLHSSMGSEVIGEIPRLRLQRVKLKKGLSEKEAIQRYMASGLVEIAERHALRYPHITPDDPSFPQQWGLTKIRAARAWDITRGAPTVIIAVIDTGVDYLHPDLEKNIWLNQQELNGSPGVDDDRNDFIDDINGWDFSGADENDPSDEDNDPMDVNGHGTHVAGVIGARGNNGIGIAGTAWDVRMMPLKVQADNGEYMESWAIMEALQYALDKGARIINCSFGGEAFEQSEYEAFRAVRDAGILVASAAGNDGVDTDANPNYPSSYDLDNIISVAASDFEDNLASFSNYGKTSVDLLAPGVDIESTRPGGSYTEASVLSNGQTYPAEALAYSGTTDEKGISAPAVDCGRGLEGSFPAANTGNYIALIERGEITFAAKVSNAQAAGAVGAIIYNNEPGIFLGTLGGPGEWIPAVSISQADGEDLKSLGLPIMVTLVNKQAKDPSSFDTSSGTSIAAPFVTGIAGLILSKYPDLGYQEVKSAILNSVDRIPGLEGKVLTAGRANALWALCIVDPLKGDLSCNGELELEDAILALQAASGLGPDLCPSCIPRGIDINGDEKAGIEEAVYALQMVGNLR